MLFYNIFSYRQSRLNFSGRKQMIVDTEITHTILKLVSSYSKKYQYIGKLSVFLRNCLFSRLNDKRGFVIHIN